MIQQSISRQSAENTETGTENIVIFEGVSKEYRSSMSLPVTALSGINLEIRRGEFLAITGYSGSGKSTLLNIIGLIDEPTSGKVLVEGRDIEALDEEEKTLVRLRTISFVFQFFNLIENFSVVENISFQLRLQGYPQNESEKKSLEILEFLGLSGKADLYPKDLSGGEQQRVAIGRALAKDSHIILCDEPTAHLDSENAKLIIELLRNVNQTFRRTVVLVTHEQSQADVADRNIVLRDGKIFEVHERIPSLD